MDKQALIERRTKLISDMRSLLDAAAANEDGKLSTEEQAKYDGMKAEVKGLDTSIETLEEQDALEAKISKVQPAAARSIPVGVRGPEAKKSFESAGEFVATMISNPNDQRLASLYAEMQMKDGSTGGFMSPPEFRKELKEIATAGSIVRPRATILPSGDSPDAGVELPAVDYSENRYGGVTVYPLDEGDELKETSSKIRMLSWTPKEHGALLVLTNKLLRNWPAVDVLVRKQLSGACASYQDKKFLRGTGVNEAMGVINSPAAILINRKTANQVNVVDITKMLVAARLSPKAIWVYNRTILPQLIPLEDTAGNSLFIRGDITKGIPTTLCGIPMEEAERLPVLGAKGDLGLYDFPEYVINDGIGPFFASSEHTKFTSGKTVLRVIFSFDGHPWLDAPIVLEDESGTTKVSPFVVLDVPAA